MGWEDPAGARHPQPVRRDEQRIEHAVVAAAVDARAPVVERVEVGGVHPRSRAEVRVVARRDEQLRVGGVVEDERELDSRRRAVREAGESELATVRPVGVDADRPAGRIDPQRALQREIEEGGVRPHAQPHAAALGEGGHSAPRRGIAAGLGSR